MRSPRRGLAARTGLVAASALALGLAAGCGQPTAQVITPEDSPLSFEIPIEYTELEDDGAAGVRSFGTAGTSPDQYGSDPVVSVFSMDGGEDVSYASLRSLSVGGRFDPVATEDPDEQEAAGLLGYVEYGEPDVWGVRLRLLLESGISDFQALVDRRSDQITLSEVHCTQACFAEQVDLIDQIQRSWSLDS